MCWLHCAAKVTSGAGSGIVWQLGGMQLSSNARPQLAAHIFAMGSGHISLSPVLQFRRKAHQNLAGFVAIARILHSSFHVITADTCNRPTQKPTTSRSLGCAQPFFWHAHTLFINISSLCKFWMCGLATGLSRKRTFEIDQTLLEKRFREMQLAVHPDKHATKGEDIKQLAQQQSAHLNTGFSILRCPLARAKYLVRSRRQL